MTGCAQGLRPAMALVIGLGACGGEEIALRRDHLARPEVALSPPETGDDAFVPGEVLIQFRPGASEADKAAARRLGGASPLAVIDTLPLRDANAGDLERAAIAHDADAHAAARAIASHPAVRFAEPNWILRTQTEREGPPRASVDDPRFAELWGLHNTGQAVRTTEPGVDDVDLDAPEAWALAGTAEIVYIGVIDEGIDVHHPDLAGRVINPGEDIDHNGVITAEDYNGLDDDGNGRVDDVHGWDFLHEDNTVFDGVPGLALPVDRHGTHVAGTINASANNGIGVVGVAPNVRLISAKFMSYVGTTADAIEAIDYLTDLRERGVRLVATNNSYGGGYSQAMYEAIQRAERARILFVAAAGNDGNDSDVHPVYPAAYPNANVISVAAIDRWDGLASFSNYGRVSVDLGAPGVDVLSTVPGGGYAYFSGTSMAAPHVTGLCGLLSGYDPSLGSRDLRRRILGTVVGTDALATRVASGGRANAYRALAANTRLDP